MDDKNIFLIYAPKFWGVGLPVIPLRHRDKMPDIKAWSQFADRMPDEAEKLAWLEAFPSGNVGLPLGSTSGLVALDVDTDDPVVLGVIDKVFPPSPWRRVGQRGYVQLYRYSGQRGFKIKKSDGTSICDFLSRGQQVVLPPSIHPGTGKAYVANCDLLQEGLLAGVPHLPANIEEVFKEALRLQGIETATRGKHKLAEFISAGSRDNELVRQAGFFAHIVLKGEWTLLEAIANIEAWQKTFVQKVHGDDIEEGKGRQKLVDMLLKDIFGPKKRTLPPGWDVGLSEQDKEALGLGALSEENKQFSVSDIEEYVNEAVARIDVKSSAKVLEVAGVVCKRLAGNANISKLQEDSFLRYFVNVTGRQLNLATLRKSVADLRKGEITGTDHRELAEAVLEEIQRVGEVRYHNGKLWQWGGAHWKDMSTGDIEKLIIREYGAYPAARKKSDHDGILATIRKLAAQDLCKVAMKGINFVNGFLTEELKLVPHNPDFGITYCLPYPYDPDLAGKTPMWLGMLNRAWGEDPDYAEKVEAVQQAMAATLFGVATSYHRCFVLFGVGASGKSQILEVIRGLMPEDCYTSIPPHKWRDKYALHGLVGKLLNIAGELHEREKIDGDVMKIIADGGETMVEAKYQQPFKFRSQAANWFASNHLPKTGDGSDGFTRRWLFLTFNRSISSTPGVKRIADYYQEVLFHERAAITAWAVQGIVSLKAQGEYTIPQSSVDQEAILANQSNSVLFFIRCLRERGQLLLGASEHVGRSEVAAAVDPLYLAYRMFCISEISVSPVDFQTFLGRLEALSVTFGFQVPRVHRHGVSVPELKYFTHVPHKKAAA